MTGAMLDQLSCEARHLERGQFLDFISSRAVKWSEMCMKYKYAVQICISYTFHTVITKNEGLQPLKYFFNQRPIKKPSLETVTRSSWTASHTQLFFIWWQLLQKQINGVAMGTKMGPSYANLFVGYIENKYFSNYQGPKADLYKRYVIHRWLRRCYFIQQRRTQRIYYLGQFFSPGLKYTSEISGNSLAFLEIKTFYQRQRFIY